MIVEEEKLGEHDSFRGLKDIGVDSLKLHGNE